MSEDHSAEKKNESRREMLKRAGVATAFAIPTLLTFKVSELKAKVSNNPGWGDGSGGGRNKSGSKR